MIIIVIIIVVVVPKAKEKFRTTAVLLQSIKKGYFNKFAYPSKIVYRKLYPVKYANWGLLSLVSLVRSTEELLE